MRFAPTIAVAVVAVAILVATSGVMAQFQTPRDQPSPAAQTTARMGGRVIAGDTGRPLRNAMVSLNFVGPRGESRGASTDESGHWMIAGLAPGSYQVSVSKAGYVTSPFGRRSPFGPGKPITVIAGQVVDRIDFTMPLGGVIVGRVFDEFGEPVNDAHVTPHRPQFVDGERQVLPVAIGVSALLRGGLVDDRGEFRIHGLPAGSYYVSAQLDSGFASNRSTEQTAYVPTYYPGTASLSNAVPLTVEAGREVNATFNLTRARVSKVSGTVINAAGGTPASVNVELTPASGSAGRFGMGSSNGTFSFSAVAQGDYVLNVSTTANMGRGRAAGPSGEFGSLPISVNGEDLTNLVVHTAPGVDAAGRVVVEDGTLSDVGILLVSAPPPVPGVRNAQASQRVQPDGSFALQGLQGRRLLRISTATPGGPVVPSPDWFLKSVTVGGQDVTDTGYEFVSGETVPAMEIVVTRRMGLLAGTATDGRGAAVTDYSVVAFSTDERKWTRASRFVRAVDSREDATFQLKGLPAGEYFVVALTLLEPGQETDSDQLRAWRANAVRVALGAEETKQIALTLSGAR